jgi:hypothetical protein
MIYGTMRPAPINYDAANVVLLNELLRSLSMMDGRDVPSSVAAVPEGLSLRMAYVFLLHPEKLRTALNYGLARGLDVRGVLLDLDEVSKYLACLTTVLGVFHKHLRASDGDVLPCIRASELSLLPGWRRLDGSDPIELVFEIERTTGVSLDGCPWWEFPAMELAQSLSVGSGQYSPKDHRRRIAEVMDWSVLKDDTYAQRDRDSNGLARIAGILWGLPMREYASSSSMASLLAARTTPSAYYDPEYRLQGLTEMLAVVLGDTSKKAEKRIWSILCRGVKAGERVEAMECAVRREIAHN